MITKIIVLLAYGTLLSNCASILLVSPLPSRSHYIFCKSLAFKLVERGHNVTWLTHDTQKEDISKNLTILTMEGINEKIAAKFDYAEFIDPGIISYVKIVSEYALVPTEFDHETEGFKALWNYPKDFKFDLIIYDSSLSRYMYIFTERFLNPPSIAVIPYLLPVPVSISFGIFPQTSYDPFINSKFSDDMNIIERSYNIFYTYYELFYFYYIHYPKEEALVDANYPKVKSTLEELESRVALVLCNINPVLDYPKILPPNIIPVGGLHAKPSRPLPTDLQKIMDDAKFGVILFSFGSFLKSDNLEPRVIKALMKVFSKLPQTVLWKFESDLDEVPKNVIIQKWFPQNDILGHQNAKLFISHGGAHSTLEALYHGVPLMVIPFLADQNLNALKVHSKQVGIYFENHQLSNVAVFEEKLNMMLNTDTYTKNMKSLSAKFHDQPLTPLETAVYWSEYMIRHGNADHLSSPTRKMPFYKIIHLDILGILLGGCVLVIFIIFQLIRFCRRTKSGHAEMIKIKKT